MRFVVWVKRLIIFSVGKGRHVFVDLVDTGIPLFYRMVRGAQLAIELGRFNYRFSSRSCFAGAADGAEVAPGRTRNIPLTVLTGILLLVVGFGTSGVLAASLFSTAKRNPHCSENQLAQEHVSILAIPEPAVKRFARYSSIQRQFLDVSRGTIR